MHIYPWWKSILYCVVLVGIVTEWDGSKEVYFTAWAAVECGGSLTDSLAFLSIKVLL